MAALATMGTSALALAASPRLRGIVRRILPHASLRDYVPPMQPTPAPQKVKIALCQLHVTEDKAANINTARKAIQVRPLPSLILPSTGYQCSKTGA